MKFIRVKCNWSPTYDDHTIPCESTKSFIVYAEYCADELQNESSENLSSLIVHFKKKNFKEEHDLNSEFIDIPVSWFIEHSDLIEKMDKKEYLDIVCGHDSDMEDFVDDMYGYD